MENYHPILSRETCIIICNDALCYLSTYYCLLIFLLIEICRMCILGKRLLKDIAIEDCHKNDTGPLHEIYCGNKTDGCDSYFESHNTSIIKGIRGLASGVFLGKSNNARKAKENTILLPLN